MKCLRIFPDLHFHKIFVKNFIFRFGLKVNCWKCIYDHLIVKMLHSIFLMSELLNILNSLYSELSYNTHVCINGKPKGMELSQYWTKSECWHMKSSIFNNNIHTYRYIGVAIFQIDGKLDWIGYGFRYG